VHAGLKAAYQGLPGQLVTRAAPVQQITNLHPVPRAGLRPTRRPHKR
jgi:hypothetical protein